MRLSHFAAYAAFGLLPLAPASAQAQAAATGEATFRAATQNAVPLRGTLRAGGKAFLIEPAQVIADGNVTEVLATANGSRVIVLRDYFRPTPNNLLGDKNAVSSYPLFPKPEPGEASVTVWNAFTRKGSVVWRQRIDSDRVLLLGFNGVLHGAGGDRVLVNVITQTPQDKTEKYGLLMIDPDRITARFVNGLSPDFGTIKPAPHLPFAALLDVGETAKNGLRFLRPDGTQTAPIQQPESTAWLTWSDGGMLLGVHFEQTKSGRRPATWYTADPRTGNLTALPARPKLPSPSDETPQPETVPELQLATRPPLPLSGTQTPSVWLEAKSEKPEKAQEKQAVLLSAEGVPVFLLPRAALFLQNGALFAAPLQTVREEELAAIERKQSRDKAGRITKQIGLAILGYIQDNDLCYPASATGLAADISDYLRDPGLLDGFVYTPPNPLQQGKIPDVGNTALGYLPGIGGKAVLYADGHVKWEDTP